VATPWTPSSPTATFSWPGDRPELGLSSSELYSATQGVFTTTSSMTTARSDAALAPLLGAGC